eukprot:3323921-Pleurochrysis_carterae.AAC.3
MEGVEMAEQLCSSRDKLHSQTRRGHCMVCRRRLDMAYRDRFRCRHSTPGVLVAVGCALLAVLEALRAERQHQKVWTEK